MAAKTSYTVYVHLEEIRDLVPTSGPSTLADPYVLVSCAGRSQRTEIVRNQINVNYDRMFVFSDIRLTQDEFERQNIHIQVFNANVIFRNELIGQYSYGFKKVWSQPDPSQHQICRRWVVLINPDDPDTEQGYMLATVTVLGPGDTPPRPKDIEEETAEVIRAPTQIGKQRRGYNILFRIFRGEHMLKTNFRGGCDGFISVKFNGISMKTSPDYSTSSPEWNTLLTFPVYTPCLTDNIDVQLWDYQGTGPDQLLATLTLRFSDVLSDQIYPTWFNLYKVPRAEM
jgi:Ca2+-dependent lipid-binding protein